MPTIALIHATQRIYGRKVSTPDSLRLLLNEFAHCPLRTTANGRVQPRQITLKFGDGRMRLTNNIEQTILDRAVRLRDRIVHPCPLPAGCDQASFSKNCKMLADFRLRQHCHCFEVAHTNIGIVQNEREESKPDRVAQSSRQQCRAIKACASLGGPRIFCPGIHAFGNVERIAVAFPGSENNSILSLHTGLRPMKKKPLLANYEVGEDRRNILPRCPRARASPPAFPV